MVEINFKQKISELTVEQFIEVLNKSNDPTRLKYMTIREVHTFFRIAPKTLLEWRKKGTIKAIPINGRVLFDRSDVLALAESRKNNNKSQD